MILVCMPTRNSPILCAWNAARVACETHGHAELYTPQEHLCVASVRNRCVDRLLSNKAYTHLMFIDDDVVVPPDTLVVLEVMGANVAVGCYPTIKYGKPVLLVQSDAKEWAKGWFSGIRETPRAGTGCMLIKRNVLEGLPHPWFRIEQKLLHGKHFCTGEDIVFCRDTIAAGFGPILANGDVRCSHFHPMFDMASLMKPEPAAKAAHT